MLSIVGETALKIQKLRPDMTVEGSKMMAAEIVTDRLVTPCIIHKVKYGKPENLSGQVSNVSLVVPERVRHTPHTKKGFVDVLLTTKPVQVYVYIHTACLEHFVAALAMSIVRTSIKS